MSESEHSIQQRIRIELSKIGMVFRVNVGKGWTGNKIIYHEDGSITIKDPRPFTTGVPTGYSDLSGHRISDGKAFYIECKDDDGKLRPEQINFLKVMKETNALSGTARSVEDALKIVGG